jgi:tetratricopeptide (TPR) repeat protein
VPWRTLSEFNEFLRAQESLSGVYVADLEEVFRQHAAHGLVGYELVSDNCHPTLKGHFLIAGEILRQLLRTDQIEAPISLNAEVDFDEYLEKKRYFDPRAGFPYLVYLKSNGRYVLKAPFFNFEAARKYYEKALTVASDDWEVWANLATLAFFEGDLEAGKSALRKAVSLKQGPIVPKASYWWRIPYLEVSVEGAGLELEAFQPVESVQ